MSNIIKFFSGLRDATHGLLAPILLMVALLLLLTSIAKASEFEPSANYRTLHEPSEAMVEYIMCNALANKAGLQNESHFYRGIVQVYIEQGYGPVLIYFNVRITGFIDGYIYGTGTDSRPKEVAKFMFDSQCAMKASTETNQAQRWPTVSAKF